MAGKHINIPVLIFSASLLLMIISSVSLEYQTLVPTLLPGLHTELEALSWGTENDQLESQYSTSSLPLKLHHVDSLMSHQGKITPESLLKQRFLRDALRVKRVFTITKSAAATRRTNGDFRSPVISGLNLGSGEYFTRIGVGSPPKHFYMIMDTGGKIIWLQCLPCKSCYKQEDAFFNPNMSSSFSVVPCGSPLCHLLQDSSKCGKRKQCLYLEAYGDGSVSVGDFSTETLTFGKKKTKVRKVAFGCGRYNKGLFVAAAGLLGLSRHKLSFLGQAGKKFGNKFSYCLATPFSNKSSSYLIFGNSSAYRKAVYTRLVKNPIPELNMFYYVGLEGISVGGSRVHGINASTFDFDSKTGGGGVIVDSGTTVTRLPRSAYVALRDAFRKGMSKQYSKPPSSYSILDTCYHLSGVSEVKVPRVDLHFRGGAKVSLPASNCMIPVDNKMTYCFAFAGTADSDGGLSIIGNIQQQGFGVVFDLAKKRVGFAPNAC